MKHSAALSLGHDFTDLSEDCCVYCGYHVNNIHKERIICGWLFIQQNKQEREEKK